MNANGIMCVLVIYHVFLPRQETFVLLWVQRKKRK